MTTPLVNKQYLLKKFKGKGGWTYAEIPEISPDPHAHFGWVKVRGSIDGYEFTHYNLMPVGNGKMFLPVKAAIRKAIKPGICNSTFYYGFKWLQNKPLRLISLIHHSGDYDSIAKSLILSPFKPSLRNPIA